MLHTLNTKQLEAIQYEKNSNVVIIAGAGSGKTTVFVERINHLINEKSIHENNILALTFTEKASAEFKKRSNHKLEYFGTFHSVFYKLLQENNYHFNFKILNESANEYFLKNNFHFSSFKTKELSTKIGNMLDLDRFISQNIELILDCNTLEEYYELVYQELSKETNYTDTNIIKKFFEYKIDKKVLSFNDIIIYTYFMIKENEEIRVELLYLFDNILIDEYQDTNHIVFEILHMISSNNLFCVGDIYQSIYSFQGSSFTKSMNLLEDFEVIQLDTNYRSNRNIVDYANNFIDTTITQKSDKIQLVKESGLVENKNIEIYENISDFTIPELISKSSVELNDIAILARNNNHIKEIKEQLEKWNVPYAYKNYREFEYLLDALLLMLANEYKLENDYFNRFKIDTTPVATESILDYLREIEQIIIKSKIIEYFTNKGFKELRAKFNKWEEKQLHIFYKKDKLDIYLDTLQKRLTYFLDNKLYIHRLGVNVLTIHKAKGLEWDTVILYNQEDGIYPRNRYIEEEARLFYVAITRAKTQLIITSKHNINSYANDISNVTYIDRKVIKKQRKYELDFEENFEDIIDFTIEEEFERLQFLDLEPQDYKREYKYSNKRDILIEDTISNYNNYKQIEVVNSINNISVEDIEIMLEDIKVFQSENEIDNIILRETIDSIDTDKKLFIENDKVNFDFINNEFTDLVHKIINFKNWIDLSECPDLWFEEKQIKNFKKIVRHIASKKHTDLTKDRAKKYIEARELNIKNKAKNDKLVSYQDFIDNMILKYYDKSNEQKKFFINNVLGMYNTITNQPMLDLTNWKYNDMKHDIVSDFGLNSEGYYFDREILKGKFLNQTKTIQAHKRWGKLRYLEHIHTDKRGFFLTLTLNSHWHRWRTKHKSLKEERKYGDGSILEDNKNFVMVGNNLEEHFINSAKKINEIWTYFYSILKVEIDNYKKKHKLDEEFEVGFFRQLEAHKNLTSHAHCLLFVNEEVKQIVSRVLNKTIEEFGLNRKFQDLQTILKTSDIKITDEEREKYLSELMELQGKLEKAFGREKKGIKNRIKKIKKLIKSNFTSPASYIGKYLLKNAFRDSEDNNSKSLEFFNAWESLIGNKVKLTGMSNYKHTTQKHIDIMYKWYQENAPEAIKAVKRTKLPIYHWLEQQEVKGNFTFNYERQIKENFKNADFIKELENEFQELKIDSLETDSYLWEIATNTVLNRGDSNKYLNIHTNKKLVSVEVDTKLIYKYSKTNYVKAIEAYEDRRENPYKSFVPTEWSFNWTSVNGKWSLTEELKFNQVIFDTLIYVEDMYIKGWITEKEIIETNDFDTYKTIVDTVARIKSYDNYAPNVDKAMNNSFKEEPDILEYMKVA